MKEQMELLLSLPFNLTDSKGNAVVDTLEFLGIDKEEIDNQMAMNIALWQTAINSNNRQQVQAIKEIRDITKDNKENQTDLNSVKEVLVKIREVAKMTLTPTKTIELSTKTSRICKKCHS